MNHALSFDLEELYHSDLLKSRLRPEQRIPQVDKAVRPILDLLDRARVRATFFVVGEVARDYPELVGQIAGAGHEIGCHTMTHPNLWRLTEAELQQELREFHEALRSAAPDQDVLGFRAPMFSIDRRSRWALGVVRDAGFRYDSSVMPARTPWYGMANAPLGIYRASLDDPAEIDDTGGLLEFPVAVCSLGPVRIPVAGGVYLRLLPFPLFRSLLHRVARKRPFVLYAHPWETYQATPSYPLPIIERFGLYTNIRHALRRLERLLDEFSFAPVREVLNV